MGIIRKSYNYFFSNEKELAAKLYQVLGFVPDHIAIFKTAFSHKSLNANSKKTHNYNNERLEFLGDAILSTIVGEYLFKKYPKQDEGFLTKMRSKIVKRNTLNEVADKMGLDVILSEYSLGILSSSMKGNALEALIGAIYIEKGYVGTRNYVIKHILMKHLNMERLESFDDNYKSRLLEFCQKEGKTVEFVLVDKYKFDKRDRFKVAVQVNGKKIGTAEDYNKKSAEQKASSIALKSILNN